MRRLRRIRAPPRMRHAAFWITAVALLALLICALWLPRKLHSNPPTQFALAGSARGSTQPVLRCGHMTFYQPLNRNPAVLSLVLRVGIFELGPDRRKDVLVAVRESRTARKARTATRLFLFSGRDLQWQHTFNDVLRFGGQDYGLPWTESADGSSEKMSAFGPPPGNIFGLHPP